MARLPFLSLVSFCQQNPLAVLSGFPSQCLKCRMLPELLGKALWPPQRGSSPAGCSISQRSHPFPKRWVLRHSRVPQKVQPALERERTTPKVLYCVVFKASPVCCKGLGSRWYSAGWCTLWPCNLRLIVDYSKLGKVALSICALGFYGLTGEAEQHY